MFINWDLPIYLVEGVFDAMAIRRNAIPLFGKSIPTALKLKIIEKEVKEVFVILDDDALSDAVVDAEELINLGVDVRLVRLSGKDPSDLGYKKIHQLISTTPKYGFGSSVLTKLV